MSGVLGYYDGLVDGVLSDEGSSEVPSLRCDTLMGSAAQRRLLAERTLEFAASLAGS